MVRRLCRLGVHIPSILLFEQFSWQAFSSRSENFQTTNETQASGSLTSDFYLGPNPFNPPPASPACSRKPSEYSPGEGGLKIQPIQNFQELHPEFPGMGSE
jgi:hypothetical protein